MIVALSLFYFFMFLRVFVRWHADNQAFDLVVESDFDVEMKKKFWSSFDGPDWVISLLDMTKWTPSQFHPWLAEAKND